MDLHLTDEQAELDRIIENDRYPLSRRIRALRAILAKDGARGGQLAGIGQKQKDHQSPQGCRHRQAQPCPKEKKTKLMYEAHTLASRRDPGAMPFIRAR